MDHTGRGGTQVSENSHRPSTLSSETFGDGDVLEAIVPFPRGGIPLLGDQRLKRGSSE